MNRFLCDFVALAALFTIVACDNDEPTTNTNGVKYEQLSEGPFSIEISNLHSSYCSVTVTPDNDAEYVWYSAVTERYLKEYGSLDDLHGTIAKFINQTIIDNEGYRELESLVYIGTVNKTVEGLAPSTRFIVFACHVDSNGEIISDIEAISAITPPITPSDNEFTITIEDISAVSAYLTIETTNDDRYVWMELPEDIYSGMNKEQLKQFLEKHYTPFFASKARSGSQNYTFPDTLDPNTNYMIIVFGYDGGMTTPLTTKIFRTLPEGDPKEVTFEFEYGNMTSRSLKLTIIPSDNSVSYLSLVIPEELILEFGDVNQQSILQLIDAEIQTAIDSGDVDNRAEFMSHYAMRGIKESEYSLVPAALHYACVVCVGADGSYTAPLIYDEPFRAPEAGETTAAVDIEFGKYFDGDLLYAMDDYLYDGYSDCAVLPANFILSGGADAAIYSCFTSASTADVPDEEIVAMMTTESNLDVYTFFTEPRVDLLLDWGVEYEIFMLALDPQDNVSDLKRVIIPAMSKSGASPTSEYIPFE